MPIEVKVPTVGESITSGVLGVWNKPDGAYVKSHAIHDLEQRELVNQV